MKCLAILSASVALTISAPAQAEPQAAPDRPLTNAAEEARAQVLFDEVRCVVCQHESIADSPAGIAADMRMLVREKIASGATDQDVRADLVRRWGDYILFKPPVRLATWLLWFGPLMLVLIGSLLMLIRARTSSAATPPLLPEEQARLDALVDGARLRPDPDANPSHD